MIRKLLLTGITLFIYIGLASAQSYNWVTGGGSTESMSPSENYEQVTHMCTDADGNVYITAITGATSILADTFYMAEAYNTFPSITHILLASYACDGTMRWAKLIEASNGALAGGITYSNGSIYLTGLLYEMNKHIGNDTTITSTNLQSCMIRYDTSGNFKWIRFIGPDIYSTELLTFTEPGAVAADGQGYIHNFVFIDSGVQVTSTVVTNLGVYDLKYDSTGNLLSATQIPELDSSWYITKVIFNQIDGKFYALLNPDGTYTSSTTTGVAAFLPDESMIWFDSTNVIGNGVLDFDYKGGNEIYISGGSGALGPVSFGGLSITDTAFPGYNVAGIFRLDTNGVAHWVYDVQFSLSVGAFGDVTILPNGQIAAGGIILATAIHGTDTIISPPGQYSPLFLIIDSSGHTIKLDQFTVSGGDDNAALTIASDAVGNVFVGGMLDNTVSAGTLSPYSSHGGNTDFFVMKYGYTCGCTTAPVASYTATATSPAISFTYTGSTTGVDSVVWTFGDGGTSTSMDPVHTYTALGVYTACVTVYTSCGSNTSCSSIDISSLKIPVLSRGAITVYPNPANDELNITGVQQNTTYRLLNVTGEFLQQGNLIPGSNTLPMQNISPGIYILEMTGANGTQDVVRVVKE